MDEDITACKTMKETIMEKVAALTRTGITMEEVKAGYDEWANNYDDENEDSEYYGPSVAVQEILRRVPPERRPEARVLDVGAGTGRLGRYLYREGFRHLDAVDPSEGMMKKLRETGVYTNEFLEFIGTGHSTIPNDTYDVVVSSGAMGEGHIPVSGMDDLVRVTKKGGLVVIVTGTEYLETTVYCKDLQPYMDELHKNGAWRKVERRVFPNYFYGRDGVLYVFCVP